MRFFSYIVAAVVLAGCGIEQTYDYERCFVHHKNLIEAEARYYDDLCPGLWEVERAYSDVAELTDIRLKDRIFRYVPDWPIVAPPEPGHEVEGLTQVTLKISYIGNAPTAEHREAILRHEMLHHVIYVETDGYTSDTNHEDERWTLVN